MGTLRTLNTAGGGSASPAGAGGGLGAEGGAVVKLTEAVLGTTRKPRLLPLWRTPTRRAQITSFIHILTSRGQHS
jgi:hypothetical protein